ncbi:MAG TPA: hypothetical protein DCE23_00885 [Firmicutes bacterium]|nr:hypothetical protein [Bacillota bacterium]
MKEIELKEIDEKVYTETLDNGLSVYMLVNEKVNNFYMTLSVKYGSVDTEFKGENDSSYTKVHNGVAHFLEHVNFNEGEGKTAHEFFNNLGSSINAFTTYDFTLYEVFASNEFEKNLNHLLDYVQTPYFTEDLIKKEKGIILEEVKMGKNNPSYKLYYGMNNALFKNDNRRYPVTGDIQDVSDTTVSELQSVYDTFYHPQNMILCITGNFNPYEAMGIIKENQSKKKFKKYKNPVRKVIEEPEKVVSEYEEIEANVEIPKVKICYKMKQDSFGEIDEKVLGIYLSIILRNNFGATSMLKEELLEKELVVGIGATRDIFNGIVTLEINVETKYPQEVIPIIQEQMRNLKLTKEDLKRRIRCNIAALINDFDDIEYMNTEIVDQLITYGKVYDDMYDIYSNLNMQDAKRIMRKINLSNSSIVMLLPFKDNKE